MTVVEPPDRARNVGQLMKVDAVTGEVVSRLQERGIRTILLKGPSFGRWLYEDRTERLYSDTDLLVSPHQADALRAALTELGFEVAIPRHELDRPVPATNWIRRRGGAAVDVHVGLTGAGASHGDQWDVLSSETEVLKVGGASVEVLAPAARTLHVVLHAAQHGRDLRPLRDLEQALERLPETLWRDAAELAARLDAVVAFAAGLRLLEGGAALADRLGLPSARSVELILREEQPPLALGLKWLGEVPGLRSKAKLVAVKLFPPPESLISDPARRTRPALVLAYLGNAWDMTRLLPAAWRALRRARREARRAQRGEGDNSHRPAP